MQQRALYIYSDSSLRDVFTEVLQKIHITLSLLPNYDFSLQKAVNYHPSLIIIDVDFEKDIALDNCKQISKHLMDIPVIVTSTSHRIIQIFTECKAAEMLSKPFGINELYTKVKSLLFN